MALFGKSGAQLLPMMNGGAAAMKEMMDDAKRLGIVMDQESGKAVTDAMDRRQSRIDRNAAWRVRSAHRRMDTANRFRPRVGGIQ